MTDEQKPENPNESIARQMGMFVLVFSAFVGSSGAGVGIGWLLWEKAGFPWWIILITSAVGLYSAVIQVLRYQRTLQK